MRTEYQIYNSKQLSLQVQTPFSPNMEGIVDVHNDIMVVMLGILVFVTFIRLLFTYSSRLFNHNDFGSTLNNNTSNDSRGQDESTSGSAGRVSPDNPGNPNPNPGDPQGPKEKLKKFKEKLEKHFEDYDTIYWILSFILISSFSCYLVDPCFEFFKSLFTDGNSGGSTTAGQTTDYSSDSGLIELKDEMPSEEELMEFLREAGHGEVVELLEKSKTSLTPSSSEPSNTFIPSNLPESTILESSVDSTVTPVESTILESSVDSTVAPVESTELFQMNLYNPSLFKSLKSVSKIIESINLPESSSKLEEFNIDLLSDLAQATALNPEPTPSLPTLVETELMKLENDLNQFEQEEQFTESTELNTHIIYKYFKFNSFAQSRNENIQLFILTLIEEELNKTDSNLLRDLIALYREVFYMKASYQSVDSILRGLLQQSLDHSNPELQGLRILLLFSNDFLDFIHPIEFRNPTHEVYLQMLRHVQDQIIQFYQLDLNSEDIMHIIMSLDSLLSEAHGSDI